MAKKSASPRQFSKLFHVDMWLLLGACFLTLFGLLMIYNSSVVIAQRDFNDPYRYVTDQATWVILGFILMFIVSLIEYHVWQRLALPLLIAILALLVAVFIPGIGLHISGASRWIQVGPLIFQPSEFAKLALIIYLASWFCAKEKGRLLAFLLLVGLLVGLVMLEPDMGTSIVLGSIAIMLYFFSGAPFYHFFLFIPPVLGAFFLLIKIAPYRASRLLTFFDQNRDPLGASYHIRQTLFALGNGGLTGVGLGKSFQKYAYLPESTTDSIFAIIAEEIGFIGCFFIIGLLFSVVYRGFMIAKKAPDRFGSLLAGGLSSFLAIQMLINLGAQVALVPFTGIPLPFISYGGSSLIITLVSVGILLSISRKAS